MIVVFVAQKHYYKKIFYIIKKMQSIFTTIPNS